MKLKYSFGNNGTYNLGVYILDGAGNETVAGSYTVKVSDKKNSTKPIFTTLRPVPSISYLVSNTAPDDGGEREFCVYIEGYDINDDLDDLYFTSTAGPVRDLDLTLNGRDADKTGANSPNEMDSYCFPMADSTSKCITI